MSRWSIWLAWVVLAGLIWALVPEIPGGGTSDLERMVVLDLGTDGAATVRLRPERGVRVIAHLDVPEETATDPRARWTYGIGLTITTPAGETTTWTHHVASRILLDRDGVPLLRAADPARRITDGRVLDLDPGFAPEGGTLTVTPTTLPPGTRLLLRLFERTGGPRPAGDRERAWPAPFPELTGAEYTWFSARSRRTLAPEQLDGRTVQVLRREDAEDAGPLVRRELRPGEATAINVIGPARVFVGATLGPARPVTQGLSVDVYTSGGLRPSSPGMVEVPDDALWSIRLHNDGPTSVFADLRSEQAPGIWGAPPPYRDLRIQPEERRIRLVRAGPGRPPIRIPVDTGGPVGLLRVDARLTSPDHPVSITWRAEDRDGKEVAQGTLGAVWSPAPFERYADPTRGRPSEPNTHFLLHPDTARVMVFTADHPVDLRFTVPSTGLARHPPEYGLVESRGSRYAPWDLSPWVVVDPLDRAGKVASGQFTTLVATVRVEQGQGDGDTAVHRDLFPLPPRGSPPRFPALERTTTAGPFRPWHRTLLRETGRVTVPDDGVLLVDYRLRRRDVGSVAHLQCGAASRDKTLGTTRGALRLAGLPPGPTDCTLTTRGGRWFAHARADGPRYAHRTLYRIDRGLDVDIPTLDAAEHLYVQIYRPAGASPPTVLAELDHGVRTSTQSLVQRPTAFSRLFTPDEVRGTALLDSGGTLERWTGLSLRLRDDVVGAAHALHIEARTDDGGPVYARVLSSRERAIGPTDRHWPERAP